MTISKQKGFTLLEGLVVIAIIAILAGIAAPSFGNMLSRSRMNSQINDWRNAFYLAQREAIQKKHRMVICASENGTSCTNGDPATATVWANENFSKGWIIYDVSAASLVQDYPPIARNALTIITTNNKPIMFLNNGRLADPSDFTLTITDIKKPNIKEEMQITPTGRFHRVASK